MHIGFCSETTLPAPMAFSAALEMQMVGEQDLDEIHVGAGKQGVDVVTDGDVVETPGRRPRGGARPVHIAERHDPRQGARQILDRVQIGDAARAHDADSDGTALHDSSAPVAAAAGHAGHTGSSRRADAPRT